MELPGAPRIIQRMHFLQLLLIDGSFPQNSGLVLRMVLFSEDMMMKRLRHQMKMMQPREGQDAGVLLVLSDLPAGSSGCKRFFQPSIYFLRIPCSISALFLEFFATVTCTVVQKSRRSKQEQ